MNRKFGRKKSNREHMLRNLVTSLVLYERITTTEPKAKEVKKEIDRILSNAKKHTLNSYRQTLAYVFDKNAAKKINEILIPRYQSRDSGFTKFYHLQPRLGDGAPMAIVELIPEEMIKEQPKNKDESKAPSPAKKTVKK